MGCCCRRGGAEVEQGGAKVAKNGLVPRSQRKYELFARVYGGADETTVC